MLPILAIVKALAMVSYTNLYLNITHQSMPKISLAFIGKSCVNILVYKTLPSQATLGSSQ